MTEATDKIKTDVLVETFSQALETMAFMMAMPPEDELPVPDKSVLVHMDFTGPISGRAEILAGMELIEMVAANIMGLEPDDPDAQGKSLDAFKELLNTTCGVLLPKLASSPADIFDVTIPQANIFDNAEQWENYIKQPDVTILDVDFSPIAVRLVISI